jgi:hypothetical protein
MELSDHALELTHHASALCDDLAIAAAPARKDILDTLDSLKTTLLSIKREISHNQSRFTAERDALRSELHCESVDREANAARVAERQRFLFERAVALPGQGDASDRASASAAFVEAAMASLCPHGPPPASGCEALCAHAER